MKPRVFVVDDDPVIRRSLVYLLQGEGFAASAHSSAGDFLARYSPDAPGCLVLDLRLADMSGLDLHERLVRSGVRIPVVMISGHAEVPTAVRAMREGVLDFLEKPFSTEDLLAAVHRSIERDAEIRREAKDIEAALERFALLTPREQEVLKGVVAGKGNKVIAAELGLSTKTVEYHRGKLMDKLDIGTIAELVRFALRLPPET